MIERGNHTIHHTYQNTLIFPNFKKVQENEYIHFVLAFKGIFFIYFFL